MTNLECVVVIPTYNEAECIEPVVREWVQYLKENIFHNTNSFQVIVVNDGSKDRTGEILNKLALEIPCLEVVHKTNSGHGQAVLEGYRKALSKNPAWVFQVDSDDQFRSGDFEKLWAIRHSSLFTLGFRESRQDPVHRLVITRILRSLMFVVTGNNIPDANIPFRLIKASHLAALLPVIPSDSFVPNVLITLASTLSGVRPQSIPVFHKERETGVISIVRWKLLRACLLAVKEIGTLRLKLSLSKPLLVSQTQLGTA